jgi:thioredoxin reductase (NADPH)
MGVVDVEPSLPDLTGAIRCGLVRHCPVCDGFEVIDQVVAVIGRGGKACREALFIRQFTASIMVFTLGPDPEIGDDERLELARAGIELVEQPVAEVERQGQALVGLRTSDGRRYRFHSMYSALGARPRCELAAALGLDMSADDLVVTDDRQRTSLPGIYAAGDIVADALNQIAVGAGHAATAAVTIHNTLPRGWSMR